MEATPREIIVCVDSEGRDPFADWLDSIKDAKTKAIILKRIGRVGDGNFGDVSPVGEGVSELKIDYGPGYRVYLGQNGNEVYLICGGTKKTQPEDIKSAKQFWSQYA